MRRRFGWATAAIAGGLLALIVALAVLQYRWLGQISDAERDRLKATLTARASEFSQDVDRELTRAYLVFQVDPLEQGSLAQRLGERYDRWTASSSFPRLVAGVFVVDGSSPHLAIQQFNPQTRALATVEWPAALASVRATLNGERASAPQMHGLVIRTLSGPIVEEAPAIIVPAPMLIEHTDGGPRGMLGSLATQPGTSEIVLLLDRQYIASDMLPAIARRYFAQDGLAYKVAVVRPDGAIVFHNDPSFAPPPGTSGDAAADLLQIRLQDFSALAADVRRMVTFARPSEGRRTIVQETVTGAPRTDSGGPLSIIVQQQTTGTHEDGTRSIVRTAAAPRWRLIVEHPSGSLERAVAAARRRNLLVSMGILSVLGVTVGLLVTTTRRAQALARQQLDFVATVSHELRTPLAVIRSAGDNLADGVVDDGARIREYGELVRDEGRRLTDLVEQILEFAGLQSGQRRLTVRDVSIDGLVREVASAAEPLARDAGVSIDIQLPAGLPCVVGDEPALRRVFENLVANAIKYGADGRWIGVEARTNGDRVEVVVADRGIGIAAADQPRVFDAFYRAPDVIAAQIPGAGLGLSLVKKIVEVHGGTIDVKSAPAAGSVFAVSLPIAGTHDASSRVAARSAAPQRT